MMLPTVFLSLEGDSEQFVAQVQRFLPDGLAYFYPRSFSNGESLISAMEERVGKASLFVLFASKKAVKSPWVGFEIDKARLAKIKDPKFRIIVVPLDLEVTHADLPGWMRDYWVGPIGRGPREIARYIRRTLITGPLSTLPGQQVYGRGDLMDIAVNQVGEIVLRTEETPNVLVLAGTVRIGRRTFSRNFLRLHFQVRLTYSLVQNFRCRNSPILRICIVPFVKKLKPISPFPALRGTLMPLPQHRLESNARRLLSA